MFGVGRWRSPPPSLSLIADIPSLKIPLGPALPQPAALLFPPAALRPWLWPVFQPALLCALFPPTTGLCHAGRSLSLAPTDVSSRIHDCKVLSIRIPNPNALARLFQ